jgi:hypothetical protein
MLVDIRAVTRCMVVSFCLSIGRLPINRAAPERPKMSVGCKGYLRPVSLVVNNTHVETVQGFHGDYLSWYRESD